METKAASSTSDSVTAMVHPDPAYPSTPSIPAVKERYRKQFLSAVRLISDELSKGTKKVKILALLKKKNMKTRTGREWTYAILTNEINKLGAEAALRIKR